MLTINNKTDYALIILSQLQNTQGFVPLSQLIERTQLPPRFVARIAADLVKYKVLVSREGKVGGYHLNKKLTDISLLSFLSIFENPIAVAKCHKEDSECQYANLCTHKHLLREKIASVMERELSRLTVADIIT
ncbi:Rrf2 family transcriptional regulator [Candidatus Roizmanbacteria bacterium]|nr:Rrf2 family transcriptional regulator [Candidatus Roizmanbacteria bacterium]